MSDDDKPDWFEDVPFDQLMARFKALNPTPTTGPDVLPGGAIFVTKPATYGVGVIEGPAPVVSRPLQGAMGPSTSTPQPA